MTLVAHAGHWLTSVAYFIPVVGFLLWLAVVQIRERRGSASERPGAKPGSGPHP